jgi:hypothetical protein
LRAGARARTRGDRVAGGIASRWAARRALSTRRDRAGPLRLSTRRDRAGPCRLPRRDRVVCRGTASTRRDCVRRDRFGCVYRRTVSTRGEFVRRDFDACCPPEGTCHPEGPCSRVFYPKGLATRRGHAGVIIPKGLLLVDQRLEPEAPYGVEAPPEVDAVVGRDPVRARHSGEALDDVLGHLLSHEFGRPPPLATSAPSTRAPRPRRGRSRRPGARGGRRRGCLGS